MAEDEIATLKEVLRKQLLVMKRLSTELDEEREASASGANEALTMILRLQKEKAEEKMEACQYKQMTEAKLLHADHSLGILEQAIRQKDTEISSLKHEAQVYKQILLNRGVNSTDVMTLHDLWFSNSAFMGAPSSCIQVRRQTSMPSIRFSRLCSEIAINEGGGSLLPALRTVWSGIGDDHNQLKEHQRQCVSEKSAVEEPGSNVYQVQEANTSMGLLQTKSVKHNEGSRTITENNQFHANMTIGPRSCYDDSTSCSPHSSECTDVPGNSFSDAGIGKPIQYVSTQHQIENPKISSGSLLPKPSKEVLQESHLEAEQMSGTSESMPEESTYYSLGDDDCSNTALKLSSPMKWTSMNYQQHFIEPRDQVVSFQSDVEQLKCQIQQLAYDVRILKERDIKKSNEQIKLLKKIHEQLNPVQSQIRTSKSKKSSPQDEALFVSLTEAMLSFSI